MRSRIAIACFAAFFLAIASTAHAWSVTGWVKCDANGSGVRDEGDILLPGVTVTVTGTGATVFSAAAVTGSDGRYTVDLPDAPGTYQIAITVPNGATVLTPATNPVGFSTSDADHSSSVNFLLAQGACATTGMCWLTGGGAKFNSLAGLLVAEHGPQHSFGGNVNPSCSGVPGEGGNWTHIAHSLKLHFQGTQIEVIRCGNIEDHPPGSESPATPFNFIEFRGTGTLKGIHGNKADYGVVQFFGRAEDRNEPGSSGAKDGENIDRYFLHVFNGATPLLLIDLDGDPATVDPVTITGGNLQIHISSCSK
jgi:hypothetical protein